MELKRSSGILMHPTSFPGTPGIGTIGAHAYRFVDWLEDAGQTLWQILPLGPTGYGDSPYASFSTFAGNPLLIDLDTLRDDGLLGDADTIPPPYITSRGPIDFGSVVWWKIPLLKKAATAFLSRATSADFMTFQDDQSIWLDDYALFMSIKEAYDKKAADEKLSGKLWNNYWPKELATRVPQALNEWKKTHANEIDQHKAIQFFFFSQWHALKAYANAKSISIIGDIPIFVAADSADVWSNQQLFQLNPDGKPKCVAGVPPDYFSATGQLWGNPLYNWDEMKRDGYSWWVNRIRSTLSLVDYIRVDHFRGFESYWSIPAGEATAINGTWEKGPDHDFFATITSKLGDLPILAEDLGLITDEVKSLRDDFNLPGMKVMQFAFVPEEADAQGYTNAFLPHMYPDNCVVYTGTHDNDTMQGWLSSATEKEVSMIRDYLGGDVGQDKIVRELIRAALFSRAIFAIFPLQDVFSLGKDTRMNTPATTGKNWTWRMENGLTDHESATWLKKYSSIYARNMR
jgi:4-alpha-glucanotransferase